jgi:tRNA(Leu) C34 or U34 (ribose-2'-O)-methylase TrmL
MHYSLGLFGNEDKAIPEILHSQQQGLILPVPGLFPAVRSPDKAETQ